MDRKDFFQTAFHLAVAKGLQVLTANPLLKVLENLAGQEGPAAEIKQRPPGAAPSENDFIRLCTGCDACMIACPVNVIMIEDMDKRHPLIYPEKAPCMECKGYPCIMACPTKALDLANGTGLRRF